MSESTKLVTHSRAMFKAAVLLSQKYDIRIEGEPIGWEEAYTNGSTMTALSHTCKSVSNSNILGIVGPETSKLAFTIADFADTIGIPVVSYAATDPNLSDPHAYPAFYRTVPSDSTAATAIVQLFLKFNWTSCVLICQNDAYGTGGAKVISDEFKKNHLHIYQTIIFDIVSGRIDANLKDELRNSPTRIVIVWAIRHHITTILKEALEVDVLGPTFVWILSGIASLDVFSHSLHQKLIGVLTLTPTIASMINSSLVNTTLLHEASLLWKQYESQSCPEMDAIDHYALFAFDAAWTLIQALQNVCSRNPSDVDRCALVKDSSSFCFAHRFPAAKELLDSVNATEFLGVSGFVKFIGTESERMDGIYYLLQNIHSLINGTNYVPILVWSETDKWVPHHLRNDIVWPGNSSRTPSSDAVLKGEVLKVGIIESKPFVIVDYKLDANGTNMTNTSGFILDLIERLEHHAGFKANISLLSLNESYSNLIELSLDQTHDFAIGDITVTSARREKVDFSQPIFDNALRVIVRKTSIHSVDLLSHFKPLSLRLWLVMLAAVVIGTLMIWLIERGRNEALQNRSNVSSFTMSLWYSIGTIMGYGADFHVTTAAGRLMTIGFYIISVVLVATYTANLASDLTLSKTKNPLSGIDEIKNGKVPPFKIGIEEGTAIEDYYVRQISRGIRNFHGYRSVPEMLEGLVKGEIDACICDSALAEYFTNNEYCSLTVIGSEFNRSTFAIAFRKKWIYAKDMDVTILELQQSGELDQLKRKWFESSTCSNRNSISQVSLQVNLETMGGLFLTFAAVSILCLLAALWKKRSIIHSCACTRTSPNNSSA